MFFQFGGRIIDTAGDGILAEFSSVANAVECAVAIQDAMRARNAGTDAHRKMQYRIGINLGDVIYDDSRIYGDGINGCPLRKSGQARRDLRLQQGV